MVVITVNNDVCNRVHITNVKAPAYELTGMTNPPNLYSSFL